jgi:hypothetical protein
MKNLIQILVLALVIGIAGCTNEGCTDYSACNYDSSADEDDGTCYYNCGGGGNCSYIQWTGTVNCSNSGSYPVSSSTCCNGSYPYYCPTTNKCYTTCDAADAACSSTVYRANMSSGGGGSGYKCVNGNCSSVSSGATYNSLSACQSACSGTTGTKEILNIVIEGSGYQNKQYAQFVLPSGVKTMKVLTQEGTKATSNHADLFVKRGSKPTSAADPHIGGYSADCASLNVNRQQDVCNFTNPQAGTWYVMLYNYNGSYFHSNLVVAITQ